jgi:hypothetical protein
MTFEVTAGGSIPQFQDPLSQRMRKIRAPLKLSSCASKLPAPAMALTPCTGIRPQGKLTVWKLDTVCTG